MSKLLNQKIYRSSGDNYYGPPQYDYISVDSLDITPESKNLFNPKYDRIDYSKVKFKKLGRVYHGGNPEGANGDESKFYDSIDVLIDSEQQEIYKQKQIEEYSGMSMNSIKNNKNNILSQNDFLDADALICKRMQVNGERAEMNKIIANRSTVNHMRKLYENELNESHDKVWFDDYVFQS